MLDSPTPKPAQIPLFSHGADDINLRQSAVRRHILEVAKQRFARQGYDGVTFATIARAADVPFAQVLMHFDGKPSLLAAVFDEGWATINLRFADIVLTSVTARDAVLSMLVVMTHILDRDEDLARLLLLESRRTHPANGQTVSSKGYQDFVKLCVDLVMRGQKDGSFRNNCHPRVVASLLIGAAESLLRDRLIADQEGGAQPYSKEQIATVFEALVSYLKP